MDSDIKWNITRRRFIRRVAGASYVCLSLDCLSAPDEKGTNTIKESKGKVRLAAACGTYCGACPAYIAKHGEKEQKERRLQKRVSSGPTKAQKGIPPLNWMDGLLCDGCLSGGTLAAHCLNCAVRKCAENKQKDSRCSDCADLPCQRITNLIDMGGYLHRREYLPNLKDIREKGVQEWVKYEEERWRCPRCGLPMSWYDAECVGCGAPRSKRLFALTEQ